MIHNTDKAVILPMKLDDILTHDREWGREMTISAYAREQSKIYQTSGKKYWLPLIRTSRPHTHITQKLKTFFVRSLMIHCLMSL